MTFRFFSAAHFFGFCAILIAISITPNRTYAADIEIARSGSIVALINPQRACGQQVGMAITAESLDDLENEAVMVALVKKSGEAVAAKCNYVKSLKIIGYVDRKPVMRAGAAAGQGWDDYFWYWLPNVGRTKSAAPVATRRTNSAPAVAARRATPNTQPTGNALEAEVAARRDKQVRDRAVAQAKQTGAPVTAADYLAHYAYLEAPSAHPSICGDFALRQPFTEGKGAPTTLAATVNQLSGGDPQALMQSHRKVFADFSTQRVKFDNHCAASTKLGERKLCDMKDFNCAVLTACMRYLNPAASAESQAIFPKCINRETRSIAMARQQTYAARIMVKGKEVRFYLGKNFGADDTHGDWCGKNLWGKVEYPQDYNVLPALAKTIGGVLNETLSARCPRAETVVVGLYNYTDKYGPRQVSANGQYLEAYKDGTVWNTNLHPDYVQTLRAKANLSALWSMVSNPTELGYATGMARYNDAASKSALSRYAVYAREGKVCKMRQAVRHCYVSTTWSPSYGGRIGRTMIINQHATHWSSCQDPCKNHEGYCNMETGARYKTAEAAERANCRPASQGEIDAAIAAVQVDSSVQAYPYEVLYLPYDQIPPKGQ
ncbi:hypothetical protein [Hyphococcus sp. DH-69]|uniref:hypothetical protein n=1 Tax=Hyphococcus formosus TaxID=3143534 RepID=UPI00398AF40C